MPADKIDPSSEAYLVRSTCPLCAAPAAESVKKVTSNPPAESIAPSQLGPLLQGYASHRMFFTYHQCRRCGLLYCPIFFSQRQLDALYSHQPENIADAPIDARARTQEAYFDILKRYSALRGDYLEIGADIGLFTEVARAGGGFHKLWLYEPNLTVHAQLRNRLAGMPHVIRTDAFECGHVEAGSLSTAVIIHVIDHLLDPLRLLQEVQASMTPGGIVLLVTHDCDSTLARLLGKRWPPYTLQHPQLFSPASMRWMLGAAGFEVLTITKTRNFFPAAFVARGALAVLGMTLPKGLDWPWPLLGLRFGNIAAVGKRF